MKCSLCHADLSAEDAVLITVKVPTRITDKNELVIPSHPVEVLRAEIGPDSVECAECGAVIEKRLMFTSDTR